MSSQQSPSEQFELNVRDRGGGDTMLELISGASRSEVAVAFSAPATSSHDERRRDYFARPLRRRKAEAVRLEDAEQAMNRLGHTLGDRLCDPDYALLQFLGRVEKAGIERLRIRIESEHPEFHAQPWELLILPDSPYFSAAACGGFVRGIPAPAGGATRELACSSERPLRVLRVLTRTQPDADSIDRHTALRWQRTLLCWDGAFQPQLLLRPSAAELLARLRDVHVLHLDAGLDLEGGVDLGPDVVSSAELYQAARQAGVELLILDLGGEPVSATAIATAATAALSAGVGNVIVTGAPLQAAHAEACFSELYGQLARGLTVTQAAVETRKALQRQYVDSAQGLRSLQLWSVLQHYSSYELRCFEQAPAAKPAYEVQALARARASMLGFRAHYLSDQADTPADANALALCGALLRATPVLMHAPRGLGATQAIHEATRAALLDGQLRCALYWNFDDERYSARDVREMLGSVSDLPARGAASDAELAAELVERRCLCVFENVDQLFEGEARTELCQLFETLCLAQAPCVFGTRTERALEALHAVLAASRPRELRLLPLTPPAAFEYAVSLCSGEGRPEFTDSVADACREIARSSQGSPFLIRKLAELRNCESAEPLPELQGTDAVASFFEWRWPALPEHAQRLLLLLSRWGDAYCEMWQASFDAPAQQVGQERGTLAGRRLKELLGLPTDETYANALELLSRGGFLVRRAAGRVVDPAARGFLASRQRPALPEAAVDELVCEGVARLAAHQTRSAHPDILDNLIANRASWRRHFEAAWRGGQYTAVVQALLPLEQLLTRARLGAEVSGLARSLLEQTPEVSLAELDDTRTAAWFAIARKALLERADAEKPWVQHAASHWLGRVRDASWRGSVLFDRALGFLQTVHDLRQDYPAYRDLAQLACEHYAACGERRKSQFFKQMLAASEFELGRPEECARLEAQLLDELASDSAAEGEHLRGMLAIASARLRRNDLAGCAELLQAASANGASPQPMYRLLHGELLLAKGDTEDATRELCALFGDALARRGDTDLDRLIALLQRAARELGAARFEQLYAEWAPQCPSPRELKLVPEQ